MTGWPSSDAPVLDQPFPWDPVLPLARALDPSAMLSIFRQRLAPERDVRFEQCSVDVVRYRPGARATVQYTVRTIDGATGERSERWITALLYPPERARHVWRTLAMTAPSAAGTGDVLPPVALAPDAHILLQTFPFDRWLPSLPDLLEPAVFADRLSPPGNVRGGRWSAEPIRYRAGLGCAFRWSLEAPGPQGTWYAKAYPDDQGAVTFGVLRGLRARRDRVAPQAEAVDVPEGLVYLERHRALVQKEVPGRPLSDFLLDENDLVPLMQRVAQGLARWQASLPMPAPPRATGDGLEDARRAGELVSWVQPSLGDTVREVVARVADRQEEVVPACTHGDFKPDHVVVRADRIAFLDLDSYSLGDPIRDVGSMLARMAAMALRHPAAAGRIAAAGRTFVEAYFERVPSGWIERLPSCHARALLVEAAGCFRHQARGWAGMMETLVQQAFEALDGRVFISGVGGSLMGTPRQP
jgi:hypothetical protein